MVKITVATASNVGKSQNGSPGLAVLLRQQGATGRTDKAGGGTREPGTDAGAGDAGRSAAGVPKKAEGADGNVDIGAECKLKGSKDRGKDGARFRAH